jgi:uncharacterized protein (TIGR03083 family)
MEDLLRDQWSHLRSWLAQIDVERHGHRPSGLPGWNVHDLVVHLGFGLVMLDEVTAAPPDAQPVPVGTYIARYRSAAADIAAATRALAADHPDALRGIDALAERAWRALDRSLPPTVMGRRGPLTRDDFIVTRMIELVVHADDLHHAVGADGSPPVLPRAATVVAETLAAAYTQLAGRSPTRLGTPEWIRRATGRIPSGDPHLPLL